MNKTDILKKWKDELELAERNYSRRLRNEIVTVLKTLHPDTVIPIYDYEHEGGLGGFQYTDTMPTINTEGVGTLYTNSDCIDLAMGDGESSVELGDLTCKQLEAVLSSVEKSAQKIVYTIIYHSLTGESIAPKPELLYSWQEVLDYLTDELMNISSTSGNDRYYTKDVMLDDWTAVYHNTDDNVFAEYHVQSFEVDKSRLA